MLRNFIKAIGVLVTRLMLRKKHQRIKTKLLDIPAESKLKTTKPNMTLDSSYMTERNKEISQEIQKLMDTPAAERLRSEMTIRASEEMIMAVAEKMQNPENQLPQQLILSLALHECVTAIQKHEA